MANAYQHTGAAVLLPTSSTTSSVTFARGGLMSRSATALSPVRMINCRSKTFEACEGFLIVLVLSVHKLLIKLQVRLTTNTPGR